MMTTVSLYCVCLDEISEIIVYKQRPEMDSATFPQVSWHDGDMSSFVSILATQ